LQFGNAGPREAAKKDQTDFLRFATDSALVGSAGIAPSSSDQYQSGGAAD
jgi:hypothetical protein